MGARKPEVLARDEYVRLLLVQDLAALLVMGSRTGYPLYDGTENEGDLIDRLEAALLPEEVPA